MTDRRVDARSGAPVVVTGARQDRPNLPAEDCPFCPGGLEAPDPYTVRWFVNRWPPLPDERAEILLYSPRHDASMWSLGVDGARAVVDLWADRTAALGARDDVAYVLVFENRGAEVGATIPHPHGQLYAFDEVPPVPARELAATTCTICADETGERLVARADDWWAAVPRAARYPYELLVAPDAHVPDLPGLDSTSRDALAAVLVDALARLDGLFGTPMPYMLWVHQRPTDGGEWPNAHVHVEIAPLLRARDTPRFVAAGELGSGVWFNPVVPEEAAAQLRAVMRR